jgi:hypothetical protein
MISELYPLKNIPTVKIGENLPVSDSLKKHIDSKNYMIIIIINL